MMITYRVLTTPLLILGLSVVSCTTAEPTSDDSPDAAPSTDAATTPASRADAGNEDGGNEPSQSIIGGISCTDAARLPRGRIRRLSREGYAASMATTLGYTGVVAEDLPPDPKSPIGFDTDARLGVAGQEMARQYYLHAEQAAAAYTAQLMDDGHCSVTEATATSTCLGAFIKDSVKRFFRRPATTEEVGRYRDLFEGWLGEYTAANATLMLLRLWAMSPNFVFRTEIGDGSPGEVQLTQHEIAAELSYLFTDAPPDAPLIADADAGRLRDVRMVEVHARRLLATPRARLGLRSFFSQVLHLDDLTNGLNEIEPELAQGMIEDSLAFVENVVFEKRGGLDTLFSAPYSYPNAAVADLYGVTAKPEGSETITGRHGLLNQAAFLNARPTAVQRGLVVRSELLCSPPPAPPPNAQAAAADIVYPENATARERFAVFSEAVSPTCTSCHQTFVPIGLTFEHYDREGRYREEDFGKEIDTSADLVGLADLNGPIASSNDLGKRIALSEIGQLCFAKRYVSYAQGRIADGTLDGCFIRQVGETLQENELSMTEMMISLVRDPGFFNRINVF